MEINDTDTKLKRSLKPRHMQMIAIGGAIGTGLFVALGYNITAAGPGGALVAYAVMGVLVYFLMTSLGEMSTEIPITGSFASYCTRFVDPALGFAVGWNYWFSWSITVALELVAADLLIKFWLPDANAFLWSAIFLALLYGLNFISARGYGEGEFWFAGIKVVTVVVFLILGVLMILGIMGGTSPGFSNWTNGEAPFVGGFMPVLAAFLLAGFSFQGTEIVGIASGESEDPAKQVPKAIKAVFWRIMIFYIGAVAVVGFLLPYTDENLLKTGIENLAVSPFTLVFERAGLAIAASVMNAVIITSVLSCGNAGMYVSTRMLYSLAEEGKAPKYFMKVNKRGVPLRALNATTLIAAACFLTSQFSVNTVYYWLLNASALTGFIAWLAIAISHYFFRRAYIAQGNRVEDLKFKAKFYPFGPLFAAILCACIIIGQFYAYGDFSVLGFFVAYIGLFIFFACYFGYKAVKKTKFVSPLEADLKHHEK
ncbi:MAG TPA: amino acid permease [Anaerovoracaceae bacterium]|nr:amino acid permease [Anaerovoracaceae bacterium]